MPRFDLLQSDSGRQRVDYIARPSGDGADTSLLVLFHGIGDSARNFADFGARLNLPQTCIVAVQAPLPLPLGLPGGAWYPAISEEGDMGWLDADSGGRGGSVWRCIVIWVALASSSSSSSTFAFTFTFKIRHCIVEFLELVTPFAFTFSFALNRRNHLCLSHLCLGLCFLWYFSFLQALARPLSCDMALGRRRSHLLSSYRVGFGLAPP